MTETSVVVLGMGNVLMSDEGVGVYVIRHLLEGPDVPRGVQLVDGGTLGLELLSIASGAEVLIVVDAIDLGIEPGTIVCLDAADVLANRGASVHQLGLPDLLSAMRMLGNEPQRVVVVGVQPARIELGTELSPELEHAIPQLARDVLAEIASWTTGQSRVVGHA